MTTRPHTGRRDQAAQLVPVTWAQLEFLVDGDPARLAALRGRTVSGATGDVVRLANLDLRTLVEAWGTTYGGDRQPGLDCAVPAWTPALAALAARRTAAAAAITQAMLDTTDYLAFGRPVPIRSLLASAMGMADPDDPVAGGPVPTADPRVTQCAADLQRLGAAYDVADAEYRDAVRHAVAASPALARPAGTSPVA